MQGIKLITPWLKTSQKIISAEDFRYLPLANLFILTFRAELNAF